MTKYTDKEQVSIAINNLITRSVSLEDENISKYISFVFDHCDNYQLDVPMINGCFGFLLNQLEFNRDKISGHLIHEMYNIVSYLESNVVMRNLLEGENDER